MVRTVVEHNSEINHRKSSQISASRCVFDSLFNGRDIVPGNRPAENVVDEFEFRAPRQRLDFDLAIAILAMAAGLFLVASLHVGASTNCFAIRDLWRLENYFRVISLL